MFDINWGRSRRMYCTDLEKHTQYRGEEWGENNNIPYSLERRERKKKLYISALAKLNVKPTLWWFTNLLGGKEKAGGGLCVGRDFLSGGHNKGGGEEMGTRKGAINTKPLPTSSTRKLKPPQENKKPLTKISRKKKKKKTIS